MVLDLVFFLIGCQGELPLLEELMALFNLEIFVIVLDLESFKYSRKAFAVFEPIDDPVEMCAHGHVQKAIGEEN